MSVTDIPYVYDIDSAFACGMSLGILLGLLPLAIRAWVDR